MNNPDIFSEACIFYHPDDVEYIKTLVVDDIAVLSSRYMARGRYVHTHKVETRPKITYGATNEDFKNNEFTVIVEPNFYLK